MHLNLDLKQEMSKCKYPYSYCLYCSYCEPTKNGLECTEPEDICNNLHTEIDLVYDHECCKHYNIKWEESK